MSPREKDEKDDNINISQKYDNIFPTNYEQNKNIHYKNDSDTEPENPNVVNPNSLITSLCGKRPKKKQCFEKDVKSIHHVAGLYGSGRELFAATLRVNENQPRRIVQLLEDELGDLSGREIGVWGLAFKSGTDDMRDSLAVRIIEELGARGAAVVAYDPAVRVAQLPPHCRMASSALEAASSDALLVLTEWPMFAQADPREYAGRVKSGVVIDGRNILDSDRVRLAGLRYRGVGRSAEPSNPAVAMAMAL